MLLFQLSIRTDREKGLLSKNIDKAVTKGGREDGRGLRTGRNVRISFIVEDCKLTTAVNLGSATLAKVSRKQVFSALSSVLECLTAVQAHSVFGPIIK